MACYVDQKDEFWLNKLNLEVTSNEEIIQLGKVLKEKLTYSLLLLDNSHYNQYVSEGQKNRVILFHNIQRDFPYYPSHNLL